MLGGLNVNHILNDSKQLFPHMHQRIKTIFFTANIPELKVHSKYKSSSVVFFFCICSERQWSSANSLREWKFVSLVYISMLWKVWVLPESTRALCWTAANCLATVSPLKELDQRGFTHAAGIWRRGLCYKTHSFILLLSDSSTSH